MSFIFIDFFSFQAMLEGIQTIKKMPVFMKANTEKSGWPIVQIPWHCCNTLKKKRFLDDGIEILKYICQISPF